MILALALFATGLTELAVVLTARWWDMQAWRQSLVAYRVRLPSGLQPDDAARWLAGIAATTHPARFALLPLPPVALETVATRDGITHYVLVANSTKHRLLAGLRAALPGARIEEAPEYLERRPVFRLAAELTMSTQKRPLATERAESASAALLAALQPVSGTNEVRVQWIVTSAGTPEPIHTANSKKEDRGWSSYLIEGTLPRDAEAVQAARLKLREPLLRATARIGVAASDRNQAHALFGRVWNTLHALNAPGVRLRRRWLTSPMVVRRMADRTFPIAHWPLLVNTAEVAGIIGLPVASTYLPGISVGLARQLPPSPAMARRGTVLGVSNYPGMAERPLALTAEDRLKHMFVLGPTGSGKSWFLAGLIGRTFAPATASWLWTPRAT